jgi:hypothetical protein
MGFEKMQLLLISVSELVTTNYSIRKYSKYAAYNILVANKLRIMIKKETLSSHCSEH